MKRKDNKSKLIYPELSYKILGCLFAVFNELGYGHKEKFYQNALKKELNDKKLEYKEQVYSPLIYKNSVVGKNFFDFLIENKIIVELKTTAYFHKKHFEQVQEYLKTSKLKLAIIANYTKDGVKSYRVVNIN